MALPTAPTPRRAAQIELVRLHALWMQQRSLLCKILNRHDGATNHFLHACFGAIWIHDRLHAAIHFDTALTYNDSTFLDPFLILYNFWRTDAVFNHNDCAWHSAVKLHSIE